MTFLATPFAVAERTLLEDDMSSLDAKQSSESEWNTSQKIVTGTNVTSMVEDPEKIRTRRW
jgi:hypothetical protein